MWSLVFRFAGELEAVVQTAHQNVRCCCVFGVHRFMSSAYIVKLMFFSRTIIVCGVSPLFERFPGTVVEHAD
jgi:hypothetical protein